MVHIQCSVIILIIFHSLIAVQSSPDDIAEEKYGVKYASKCEGKLSFELQAPLSPDTRHFYESANR